MINIKEDIQPLTTFRNNSAAMLKRLKKTGRPMVLTVNGQSEMVIHSAASYQKLLDRVAAAEEDRQRALDIAADASVEEGIRQGLEDVAAGRTIPAEKVFADLRKRYGLPSRILKAG